MYGLFIKGRGWIKTVHFDKDAICCRNFTDVHSDFKFKFKTHIKNAELRYATVLDYLEYEVRTVSEDDLVDKRVVPSKKYNYAGSYDIKPLDIVHTTPRYSYSYCGICNLYVTNDEAMSGSICIHCLMAIVSDVEKLYANMDEEIKRSWERAKMIDEI